MAMEIDGQDEHSLPLKPNELPFPDFSYSRDPELVQTAKAVVGIMSSRVSSLIMG